MCFSATANFVGSGVLGAVGVVTLHQGEAPAGTAFRGTAFAIRHSSVHRGIRVAGIGWNTLADCCPQHGRSVHAICAGIAAVPATA